MDKYYEKQTGRSDCIYCVKNGKLERNTRHINVHNTEDEWTRDKSGVYVLMSNDFLYCGKSAIEFDAELLAKLGFPKKQETKTFLGDFAREIISFLKKQKRVNLTHRIIR